MCRLFQLFGQSRDQVYFSHTNKGVHLKLEDLADAS